jgi:hypothetical protein
MSDRCGLGIKGSALALLLGATTYSSGACVLSNTGIITPSPAGVSTPQISVVPGIVALAMQIAAETPEKMKP